MERCTLRVGDQVKFEQTIYETKYFKNEAAGDLFKVVQWTGRKIPGGTVGVVVSVHKQEWTIGTEKDERGEEYAIQHELQWLVSVDFGNGFIECQAARGAVLVRKTREIAARLSY